MALTGCNTRHFIAFSRKALEYIAPGVSRVLQADQCHFLHGNHQHGCCCVAVPTS
jgi:hypothetical protein